MTRSCYPGDINILNFFCAAEHLKYVFNVICINVIHEHSSTYWDLGKTNLYSRLFS